MGKKDTSRKKNKGQGSELLIPEEDFLEKLSNIRIWLFDWDGVFNTGLKHGDSGSPFSEADSMGTNLLRYSGWLNSNGKMPVMGIVTGAQNETAAYLAGREKFNFCYRGFKHKIQALEEILKATGGKPEEVGFFFDDVLDLSIARICGLRLCMRTSGLREFHRYIKKQKTCDYLSGVPGGRNAIRETSDFILRIQGNFDEVLESRITYSSRYQQYLAEKSTIETATVRLADP